MLKEHPDKLKKEGREEGDETIVPGWEVLYRRFKTLPTTTKVKITYTGEKKTNEGDTAKQFDVLQWVDD